ncbi:hypothetical protein Tco_0820699 [Tanacetum coccineum]|uniref:Uncharacterized protein n=1 Tax=Tanacetum coccineum TaxID=301880 RepID=A0ABQ5AA65_9ASTR
MSKHKELKLLRFIYEKDNHLQELRKKLEKAQQEKDSIQFNVNKFENASKSLDKLIECQIVDNYKKEEFTSEPVVIKPVVENSEAKASKAKPKVVRKNNGALISEDWVSDSEEEDVPQAKIEKKILLPSTVGNFLQEIVEFRRISLTGFRSCASRSQTGASQSRKSTE